MYCGVAPSGSRRPATERMTSDDAAGVVAFVADIDIAGPGHSDRKRYPPDQEAALAIVRALPLETTVVVHSGGGLHLWWLLREPWVFEQPDDPKAVQIIAFEPDRRYEPADFEPFVGTGIASASPSKPPAALTELQVSDDQAPALRARLQQPLQTDAKLRDR